MQVRTLAPALAVWWSCVAVTYQRAGDTIAPRRGQTLVFGRLRCVHDDREFFPWGLTANPSGAATDTERHVWLLRLGRRAVSTEIRPDADGALAIWLASGDYALLGSIERLTTGAAPYEVLALFRVPAGPAPVYVGELTMTTMTREGAHFSHGELGEMSVAVQPLAVARVTLEQRLGTLPQAPVASPWCVGDDVPGFSDAHLAARARMLLDRACGNKREPVDAS